MATETSADTVLKAIGLKPSVVTETLKNAKLTASLLAAIDEAGVRGGCDATIGSMIYNATTKYPAGADVANRPLLLKRIAESKIKTMAQLEAALAYFKRSASVSEAELDSEAGVGVVVSRDEVAATVNELFAAKSDYNKSSLVKAVLERHKWADAKLVFELVDAKLKSAPTPAAPAKKPAPVAATTESTSNVDALRDKWPMPHENDLNKPEILAAHLKRTGGRVLTRFPPEPNGWPHVGHAKAMWIDFGQAELHHGDCYLRFDDTNPAAEKQEYIDAIQENVAWMGYKPFKVTYASDHFQTLYDMAVTLIKKGKAYVSHSTKAEIKSGRQAKTDDKWRDRSLEENLVEFEKMKNGFYKPGEAMLRLKMNMQSPNPCMRDLVAYRVMTEPHPRTGTTWNIYPSYDYTHCICDSLEDITHSLCTLEFNVRRESYYWVLDELDLFKPIVWEYSRLNLTHTVVSKRTLRAMVERGLASGWDDPRMPTLIGMRRRGFSPAAIRSFCEKSGVTRTDNTMINYELLESCVRADLDVNARRTMMVLEPLKVTLTNFDATRVDQCEAFLFPAKKAAGGTYKLPLTRVIYIERSDFRDDSPKDFFGLEPNKKVGLKYAGTITCTKVITGTDGSVSELEATFDASHSAEVKGHIHWVAEPTPGAEPVKADVHLFKHLFSAPDMTDVKDWEAVLTPNSDEVKVAYVEPLVASSPVGTAFQAERLAYFNVDKTSTATRCVLNRVVPLREASVLKAKK
eukprot:TRINITY_DN14618_c0_g1_i1.p1 TRINITY_DN14618_c0_g1~~TRINITY_DN14618_c0_g1_i1.p1  ORF type:complete len:752 (+),score=187.31 TRINITY_DN14618_c0_g1_i1:25-2256(+)